MTSNRWKSPSRSRTPTRSTTTPGSSISRTRVNSPFRRSNWAAPPRKSRSIPVFQSESASKALAYFGPPFERRGQQPGRCVKLVKIGRTHRRGAPNLSKPRARMKPCVPANADEMARSDPFRPNRRRLLPRTHRVDSHPKGYYRSRIPQLCRHANFARPSPCSRCSFKSTVPHRGALGISLAQTQVEPVFVHRRSGADSVSRFLCRRCADGNRFFLVPLVAVGLSIALGPSSYDVFIRIRSGGALHGKGRRQGGVSLSAPTSPAGHGQRRGMVPFSAARPRKLQVLSIRTILASRGPGFDRRFVSGPLFGGTIPSDSFCTLHCCESFRVLRSSDLRPGQGR